MAGAPDALEHLTMAIQTTPDDCILAAAAVLASRALLFAGRLDEAHTTVQRTLDRLGADRDPQLELALESVRMQLIGANARWTAEARSRLPSLLARAQQAGDAGRRSSSRPPNSRPPGTPGPPACRN